MPLINTTFKTNTLYLDGKEYKLSNKQEILTRLTSTKLSNNTKPIFGTSAINEIMLSRDFDDHCTNSTLATLHKSFKLAVQQTLQQHGLEFNDEIINKILGCNTTKEFDDKFNFEHGGRIRTYLTFIKQQLPFAGNENLQRYIQPSDIRQNLVTQNFDEIYAQEVKLHDGILTGIGKINLFKDSIPFINISLSIISNNIQANLDKASILFQNLIPINNFCGIDYSKNIGIEQGKPHFSYLALAMNKIFGIDLNSKQETSGKLFIYSGDRDKDVEFAVNAHRRGIASVGILHDVSSLTSNAQIKQQLLEFSQEVPIFILSGDINDTVAELTETEIGICEAVQIHNQNFSGLSNLSSLPTSQFQNAA